MRSEHVKNFRLTGKVVMLMVISAITVNGCGKTNDVLSEDLPWTNFTFEIDSEGRMVSLLDSTSLEVISGYDLLIRSERKTRLDPESTFRYFHARNADGLVVEYVGPNGYDEVSGILLYNEDGYVFVYRSWYSEAQSMGFSLADFNGAGRLTYASCIGYSDDVLMLVQAQDTLYTNYNLEPLEGEFNIECENDLGNMYVN